MRNIIIAIGIALLASAPMARGQSAEEPIPAPTEGSKIIAESAEAAEEAEEMKRSQHFWIRTEFLLWWLKDAHLPPLVTTGPTTDPRPGSLDSPNTSILLGGEGWQFQDRYGARLTLGYWFDDQQCWGAEGGYFFLGGRTTSQGFLPADDKVLAIPFFNLGTGLQDAGAVAYPGLASGHVLVGVSNDLQGGEINLTTALLKTEHVRLEGLVGLRYLSLDEGLSIYQSSTINVAPSYAGVVIPNNGNIINVSDQFETRNRFFGGQLGARAEFRNERWTLEILTKVALGDSNETVNIHGSTTINTQPVTAYNAGFLALSSNSGQFSRNAFSVVPEINATLGFQLTDHIKLFAGYSFLYWTNVVRPGDQVDTAINPNLVPTSTTYGAAGGPNRPGFAFRTTDFFAHGVNMGLEFRY
jgi:hypothetical protein